PRIAESNSIIIRCIDEEKEALLTFEQSPMDEYGALSSWGTEDDKRNCCEWRGVCCNNTTSHFKVLNLRRSNDENARRKILKGTISPALLKLHDLRHLDLSNDQHRDSIPEAFHNTVSLRYLSLPSTELDGGIPKFFGIMCSLNRLRLPFNNGQLSELIQNLSGGCMMNSLESLYLGAKDLTGPIPDFGGFSSLKELRLRENRLNGTINKSLSQLSKLESLSLGRNSFTGVISETFFNNIRDWVPPFQLTILSLASCKMGPHFPKWLQAQNQLISLDISNNGISDSVPDRFWDLSIELSFLDLSNNHIRGKLPDLSLLRSDNIVIDISSNHFEGLIPPLPSNSISLKLSKNKFSGSITFLCSISQNTWNFFDLSNNLLSRELPDCWLYFNSLSILDLINNSFSGKIPNSMGFLRNSRTLSLHNNRLTRKLPKETSVFHFLSKTLYIEHMNCSQLRALDLKKNAFCGEIPTWIRGSLQNLTVLSLKSNKFHGNIPYQLCNLRFIQVLDLSSNILSRKIPKCFNNFSAITQERSSNPTIGFRQYVVWTWKGSENGYENTLGLVKCLDLSNNKLCGAIPEEIMDVLGLIGSNLSRNNLIGAIPPKIGQLKSLDFLDLSRNRFSGSIPSGLAQLSRLGVLDLSDNSSSGKIPLGTQIQSFNPSVYAGNLELCGLPLQNKCPDEESAPCPGIEDDANTPEDEDDQFITLGFYMSLILGFCVGFWESVEL
ncbi:hypothetical protein CICLE_v10007116mg, partial [Citrus x clementina]